MSSYRIAIVTSDMETDWASRRLLQAANELCEGGVVDARSLGLRTDGSVSIGVDGRGADAYDAFILRGFNRRGEIDFQYEIFEILVQQGKTVVNAPAALSLVESKAQTTYVLQQAGLPVPRTMVTQELEAAAIAVREFGTAVVKPLYGSFGIGIERIGPDMINELVPAFLERYGVVYVQEYIPNEGRDMRVFVVGDDVPAAVSRVACAGEWKTNVYQGSACEPCNLTDEIRELCLEAARITGLEYTGVDLIEGPDGPVILELNGTPAWRGLYEATRRDVAVDVIRHVLWLLESGQRARQPVGLRPG